MARNGSVDSCVASVGVPLPTIEEDLDELDGVRNIDLLQLIVEAEGEQAARLAQIAFLAFARARSLPHRESDKSIRHQTSGKMLLELFMTTKELSLVEKYIRQTERSNRRLTI